MREFKLNSNNKHVATDWGLHVDLTVRADALHEPNVSLLWTLRTLLQDSMLHIKQTDAVSLRNITRQINAILSFNKFLYQTPAEPKSQLRRCFATKSFWYKSFRYTLIPSRCKLCHVLGKKRTKNIHPKCFSYSMADLKWSKILCNFTPWVRIETTGIYLKPFFGQ